MPLVSKGLILDHVSPNWLESLTGGTASTIKIPIRNGATYLSTYRRQNCHHKKGSTMTDIPHPWGSYARLQRKLFSTNNVTIGAALEEALNVVHQPDFRPETITEVGLLRMTASAARQGRHRDALRRRARSETLDSAIVPDSDDCEIGVGPMSLDDALHARRELTRIATILREADWELLIDVAAGLPYQELAVLHASTSTALRSRVCRLRQVIG